MRLTEFIEQNEEKIIEEWVKFASTLLPQTRGMSDKDLRDHAAELLKAVVLDMEAPQSKAQQAAKSQGQAEGGALVSVGRKHASQRLATGFNLAQLVSEYRALRASILRLWAEAQGDRDQDVTRFNEAIDESLTVATVRYSTMLDQTREQFLAVLGHDLRNPLSAIIMGARMLTASESIGDREAHVAARVLNSAGRMNRMVNDLLDFTRSRLGSGIPVTPKPMDLAATCQQVIAELEAIHPDARVRFDPQGNLLGEWDDDRLFQVISNLVANALQYGGQYGPVGVEACGRDEGVVLRVHNRGPAIPEDEQKRIFEPMVRRSHKGGDRNPDGLGLGLYIAREIVTAHGGTLDVTSTENEGTTFTLALPYHAPNT